MKYGKSIGYISSAPSFNGFIPAKGGVPVCFMERYSFGETPRC